MDNTFNISYESILEITLSCMFNNLDHQPCSDFQVNDFGEFKGVKIFIIPEVNVFDYPGKLWVTKVDYGSCSGCDTLKQLDDVKIDDQLNGYMLIALHLIENMKEI